MIDGLMRKLEIRLDTCRVIYFILNSDDALIALDHVKHHESLILS